jgi:RHS repeat-associated protein
VAALTDVNGTFVEYYEYNVFGEPIIWDVNTMEIVDSSVVGNPYMFTGREYDSDTGLYYYRARYYNPYIGRFLQPDSLGYIYGLNLYTYARNNPIRYTDPWGLKPGDRYLTQDAAASDAISDINPKSIKEYREYGGQIYKNSDGTYSYTPPRQGTRDSVNPGPKPNTGTGYYHTHGGPDPGYDNEHFSRADKEYADRNNADGYLGTPSNKQKRYDNLTKKVTELDPSKQPGPIKPKGEEKDKKGSK